MRTHSLQAEQDEKLDHTAVGAAQPVRQGGVELGGLAGSQCQVPLTGHEPQVSGEHVEPFEAFVDLRSRFDWFRPGGDDHLERVYTSRSPGQGHERHPEPSDRLEVDARVASARGTDEIVQRNVIGTGKRQQQFQARPALPALQPGQGALRNAGRRREVGKGDAACTTQRTQPRPHRVEHDFIRLAIHTVILPLPQDCVPFADGSGKTERLPPKESW